ncbi:MAG TPA: hypothetical protein DCS93_07705 [Microscillaceae bacterium]|nr:hypothetical protein [Microscillaceae bacterium]
MQNLLNTLKKYYSLSNEAQQLLLPRLEPLPMKKGEVVIPELYESPYVFFIEQGAIKTYNIDEKGNKEVVWFGFEGDLCFSLSAYFDIPPVLETCEMLEDGLLYRGSVQFFRQLHRENLEWANWARCFAEVHLVQLFQEIDEHRPLNAKERYLSLIKSNPNIQQRAPLKDIASYLGVSPVTISRFRKEMK